MPPAATDSLPPSPVFTLQNMDSPQLPVLLAAPHGGRAYTADLLNQMRAPEFSQLRLEDRYIDLIAQQVAANLGAPILTAHTPRAVLDLNRAPADVDWSMISGKPPGQGRNSVTNRRARGGLGLVPRRLPKLGEIWKGPLPQEELDTRIAAVHRPYHTALAGALSKIRDVWGAALLIDLHSMPPLPLPPGGGQPARFVVGDRFGASCDAMLTARAFRYFSQCGELAAHNRPYAGGYILDRHARTAEDIHALQLEVCRSIYLDPAMAQLTPNADGLVSTLTGLVRTLAHDVAATGQRRSPPLAAE